MRYFNDLRVNFEVIQHALYLRIDIKLIGGQGHMVLSRSRSYFDIESGAGLSQELVEIF